MMIHVRSLLTAHDWWRLTPCRHRLSVNGQASPYPTAQDLSPPQCAAIPGRLYIAYIPRGNQSHLLKLTDLKGGPYSAEWFNPRDGRSIPIARGAARPTEWTIPDRPEPSEEDWVLVLSSSQTGT